MRNYILKRLLLMVPTLIGITLVTYFIVRLAPGDPVEAMIRNQSGDISPKAMKENAERIRERLGLIDYHPLRDALFGTPAGTEPPAIDNHPAQGAPSAPAAESPAVDRQPPQDAAPLPPEQRGRRPAGAVYSLCLAGDSILSAGAGYARWISHIAVGNFGESIKFRTSSGSRNPLLLILERIPVTGILNIISETLIFVIAIPAGLVAARHHGRWFDRGSSFVILALWSIPAILAGTVLIGYLGKGGEGAEWFPIGNLHSFGYEKLSWPEYLGDLLWHATLPVVCLTYGGLAYMAKLGRASLLENLRADFVRTARAKGLTERRVVYHHALRNSLLPMITVMVLTLPGLIGGSVIVESIFSIQGTGLLLVDAAKAFDLALIMAETLLYGVLTLVFLLIGDLCYAWADPRVRYE